MRPGSSSGRWLAGGLTMLLAAVGAAQPLDSVPVSDPLIQNVAERTAQLLDGEWAALLDPYEVWDSDLLPLRTDPFKPRLRRGPSDLNERDFGNAWTLEVPGDWNTQRAELLLYEGSVWYLRTFELDPQPGRRYFLYFGAANYRTRVALNGEEVGQHEGGFTPFQFEITERLREGAAQELLVKVNNRRIPDGLPGLSSDWWNYGGLTRSVRLLDVPETFVREFFVHLAEPIPAGGGGSRRVAGWVEVDGAEASGAEVTVSIEELDRSVTVTADAAGGASFEFDLGENAELWSPDRPKRYAVSVSAADDRVSDRVGFRSLEVRGADLLLNGQQLYLRGINSHEEAPFGPGRVRSAAEAAQLLDWVDELNANFLRLAHYPHNEEIVRLADERGILLWAEVPVYWQIDFGSQRTRKLARQMLGELIARDRNRAAVVLWSVANETPNTPERLDFLGDLIGHVRALDPTRWVTSALLPTSDPRQLAAQLVTHARARQSGEEPPAADFSIRLEDPLGELLDVVGHNAYYGWYYSSPIAELVGLSDEAVRDAMLELMPGFQWSMPFDKPLVFSEFGAGAKAGLRGSDQEIWTEEYQARAYRAQLEMMRRIPFVRGTAPWILRDFRSPLRQLGGIQDGWNRKGVVSAEGKKKLAFEVLRGHYADIERDGR